MQKIMIFVLFLCLVLSLYSYCFEGEELSFQAAYKNVFQRVNDIGTVFSDLKGTVVTTLNTVISLPGKIADFFVNFFGKIGGFFTDLAESVSGFIDDLVERIKAFFAGIRNTILNIFGVDTKCTCSNPEECEDCPCNAKDCRCGVIGGSRGKR